MSLYAIRLPDGRLIRDPGWHCVADVMAGAHGQGSTSVVGEVIEIPWCGHTDGRCDGVRIGEQCRRPVERVWDDEPDYEGITADRASRHDTDTSAVEYAGEGEETWNR